LSRLLPQYIRRVTNSVHCITAKPEMVEDATIIL